MMNILFKRGNDRLVYDYEEDGRVFGHVITGEGVEYPVTLVDSILARGYWEQVDSGNKSTLLKFDPDQPRDELGRFGSGGGESSNETGGKEYPTTETVAPHEAQAVLDYIGSGYENLNASLRNGEQLSTARQDHIATLDKIIAEAPPLEQDTVVYRAIQGEIAMEIRGLQAGDTFTDKAYSSTSKYESAVTPFKDQYQGESAVLHITAPAGTSALDVNAFVRDPDFGFKEESEVLLPRDTTYEVTRIIGENVYVRVTNG